MASDKYRPLYVGREIEGGVYKSIYSGEQVDEAVGKIDNALTKDDVVQVLGYSPDKVMSQQSVTLLVNGFATKDGVDEKISEHNTSSEAHEDIRQEVSEKATPTDIENAINEHNISNEAHEDIRNLINLKPDTSDITNAVSTHNSDTTAHSYIQEKIGTDISAHNSSSIAHSDIRQKIGTDIEAHNTDTSAHTYIQNKIGTDISTHNDNTSAHTFIQNKIGTDIGTHNTSESAHTFIQNKIGTDIGTHNTSSTAHSDIRQEITSDISVHNESNTAHQDIRTMIGNKPSIENSYSESQSNTYSANYVNTNFAPVSFVSNLYATKSGTNSATLTNATPTIDSGNILTSTTINTDYNWNVPDFIFTRQIATNTTLTQTNSFELVLQFIVDRDCTLSFGSKISVSTDNGTTWTAISENQTTSSQEWATGVGNTIDILTYTDKVTTPTMYPKDTLIRIEIYKKQLSSQSLTTNVYCGVLVDGANIYTYARYNFSNVNLGTNQLEDGSVTYKKLDYQVQQKISVIADEDTINLADQYKLATTYDSSETYYTESGGTYSLATPQPNATTFSSGTYYTFDRKISLKKVYVDTDTMSGNGTSTNALTVIGIKQNSTSNVLTYGDIQQTISSTNKISADNVDDTNANNKFVTSNDISNWNGKQDLIDDSHKLSSDLVTDSGNTNLFVTSTEKSTWNGKQNAIDSSNKLASDLVDDTNQTNKFVTTSEKSTWNGKQNAITNDNKLSSDLVTDTGNTNKFVTQSDINTWNAKQNTIDSTNKLNADYVDDTSTTNKFVTSTDITNWNNKVSTSDLYSALANYENVVNKTQTINSSSTSTQYPSASAVYDVVENAKPLTETATITSLNWTASSYITGYDYQATITLNYTLTNDTIVELINNNLSLFMEYCFAIYSISGQDVTILSMKQPINDVTLTFLLYNKQTSQAPLYPPTIAISQNDSDYLEITPNASNPQNVQYVIYYDYLGTFNTLTMTSGIGVIDVNLAYYFGNAGLPSNIYPIKVKTQDLGTGNYSDFSNTIYYTYSGSSPQPTFDARLEQTPKYDFTLNLNNEYEVVLADTNTYTFTRDVKQLMYFDSQDQENYIQINISNTFTLGGYNFVLGLEKRVFNNGGTGSTTEIINDTTGEFEINGETFTYDEINNVVTDSLQNEYQLTFDSMTGEEYFTYNDVDYYLHYGIVINNDTNTYINVIDNVFFEYDSTQYEIQMGNGLIDSNSVKHFISYMGVEINGTIYFLEERYDGRPYCMREEFINSTSWADLESNNIVSVNNGILTIDESNLTSDYYYELFIPNTVTEIDTNNFEYSIINRMYFNSYITTIGTTPFANSEILSVTIGSETLNESMIYPSLITLTFDFLNWDRTTPLSVTLTNLETLSIMNGNIESDIDGDRANFDLIENDNYRYEVVYDNNTFATDNILASLDMETIIYVDLSITPEEEPMEEEIDSEPTP